MAKQCNKGLQRLTEKPSVTRTERPIILKVNASYRVVQCIKRNPPFPFTGIPAIG